MMRALWTSASGMIGQQLNVDTISNNLANVNTNSYKKEKLEFKSLLYETIKKADQDPANIGSQPVNLQVGHGVMPVATSRKFSMGTLENTHVKTDFAINGKGFFAIDRGNGNIAFTRDGNFKLSPLEGELSLVTSEGFPVLNSSYEPIKFNENIEIDSIEVDRTGNFKYIDKKGKLVDLGFKFGIFQFNNRQGLESIGSNLFLKTAASGEPTLEDKESEKPSSQIMQNYLERSNVQIAEEMVDLIVAQRAYELNSKAIQTSDDMLQQANNLKRS